MRSIILTAALIITAVGQASAQRERQSEQAFTWRGQIDAGEGIWIKNIQGSIEVERAPGNELIVTAEKSWRRDDPEIVEIVVVPHDGGVTICALWDSWDSECDERGGYHHRDFESNDVKVHFRVQLPSGVKINAGIVSGHVTVMDADAPVVANSVSGDVEVRATTDRVRANSVSGDVTVEGTVADVEAHSVSGSVSVDGARGYISAKTVSGSIDVSGGEFTEGEFETVSGRIRFTGDLNRDGEFYFKTLSGSIRLILPEDVSADFDLSTWSGRIRNEFGPAARTRSGRPARELRFSVGSGGAEVEAESFSGSISIIKR